MIDIYKIAINKDSYEDEFKFFYDDIFIEGIKLFMEEYTIIDQGDSFKIESEGEIREINKKYILYK